MMNIMQMLAMMGGLGGAVPAAGGIGLPHGVTGINPNAPAPGSTPMMPPVTSTAKRPFMDRLAMQLFQSQNPGQESNPEQRRNAMLQLGLGMLAAGSQGQGLGQGIFNAYGGAAGNFQGALDRAYTNAERKRLEEKEDQRRGEDIDWRKTVFGAEFGAAERRAQAEERRHGETLKSAERRSAGQTQDDLMRARVAELKLDQERQDRQLLKPIEDKLRRGEQLTPEEKDLYQLIRTGRQPSFNPMSLLFGGGFDQSMGPGGGQGNPLLTDPRLNFGSN